MVSDRFDRFLPLAGVLAGLLFGAAYIVYWNHPHAVGGPAQTFAYWQDNRGIHQIVGLLLLPLIAFLLTFFGAGLKRRLEQGDGYAGHGSVAFGVLPCPVAGDPVDDFVISDHGNPRSLGVLSPTPGLKDALLQLRRQRLLSFTVEGDVARVSYGARIRELAPRMGPCAPLSVGDKTTPFASGYRSVAPSLGTCPLAHTATKKTPSHVATHDIRCFDSCALEKDDGYKPLVWHQAALRQVKGVGYEDEDPHRGHCGGRGRFRAPRDRFGGSRTRSTV